MAAPPEPAGDWYSLIAPGAMAALAGFLAFIVSYFKKAEEANTASAGPAAAKAIGAAFVDESAQAAILRIDTNVEALAKLAKAREDRERDDEIAERAAEKAIEDLERRLNLKRKD